MRGTKLQNGFIWCLPAVSQLVAWQPEYRHIQMEVGMTTAMAQQRPKVGTRYLSGSVSGRAERRS